MGDSSVGRTFFLTQGTGAGGAAMFRVLAYDQQTFRQVWSSDFRGVAISAPAPGDATTSVTLIRWGDDGLAFRAAPGQIVLVRAPQIAGQVDGSAPVVPTATIAPTPRPAPGTRPPAQAGGPQIAQLDLVTNDLVYDPLSGLLYASVPSGAGGIGNSVVPIDPVTGALGAPIFVGSEPNKLALSDDGRYLYVALDGAAAVRRVDLASRQAGLQFSLGNNPTFGAYYVEDMLVLPGEPETIAVARRYRGVSPAHAGVAIYTDGVKRALETPSHTGADAITACGMAGTLYGFGGAFYTLTVNEAGITIANQTAGAIGQYAYNQHLRCDDGRIYASTGQVVDPVSGALLGTYANVGGNGLVQPDSTVGRTFFLAEQGTTSAYKLLIFDQRTFVLVASFDLPQLVGEDPHPIYGGARGLVRWGADGLAYHSKNQVFLLRSPLIAGAPATR